MKKVAVLGYWSKDCIVMPDGSTRHAIGGPIYFATRCLMTQGLSVVADSGSGWQRIENADNLTLNSPPVQITFPERDGDFAPKLTRPSGLNEVGREKLNEKIDALIITPIIGEVGIEALTWAQQIRGKSIVAIDIQGFQRGLETDGTFIRKAANLDHLQCATVLKITEKEFKLQFDGDFDAVASYSLRLQCTVIITYGSWGVRAAINGEVLEFPQLNRINAVTTVGAGDRFLASFVGNKVLGMDDYQAILKAQEYVAQQLSMQL